MPDSDVVARQDRDGPTAAASEIRRSKAARLLFVRCGSGVEPGSSKHAAARASPRPGSVIGANLVGALEFV
jgi:hypothetical protein